MTATVDIVTKRRENVIGVPISSVVVKADTTSVKKFTVEDKSAVKSKDDKRFECVFVRENGKAKLRVVKTGIQDDTNIEIVSGLKKGEEVITGPYTTVTKDLTSGDKVKEAKPDGKADKKGTSVSVSVD